MRPSRTALAVALGVLCAALLLPAVLLTSFRLVEPSWPEGVQAISFAPFALPLYAAALLLLGAVMLAGRRVQALTAAPAALALVGGGLHLWWVAPLVAGEVPRPAAGADPVVVMTANVLRGRADGVELMAQVREHDVDLLVLTEITQPSLAAMHEAGLDAVLPHRAGRPGPAGAVVGTMVLSDEPTTPVDVVDTELDGLVVDSHGLRVVAVHPRQPAWLDDWRRDHAAVMDAVVEHDPDLLAGDFNAVRDHRPMRALQEAGYRDSVEISNGGFQPTWPANGAFGLLGVLGPVAQIDHVLVSEAWTAVDAETIDLDGTDHRPVVATVAPR